MIVELVDIDDHGSDPVYQFDIEHSPRTGERVVCGDATWLIVTVDWVLVRRANGQHRCAGSILRAKRVAG